ncbi:MAG: hypothetical protein A2180_14565 [Pseudomonadales bacterium GWC2_63_15]|uniref:hypothetical protein n=1 Tax=Stutzerimonas kunmingensis TaxID=1211807 RepID=UPI0008CC901F|nr:MAG: hypothetical protein A2180_14565 [Pseudomonadales bacterium GWC2_63_15]
MPLETTAPAVTKSGAENSQELQIVQAFSNLSVPERIIQQSNIKELLHGLNDDQQKVQSEAKRLAKLRKEKKEGNFVGNWFYGRSDKIQEAQLDLNALIGQLTQKSSQLLVVNTAISKVLSDQQILLLQQQNLLKKQAEELQAQNERILAQQIQLGEQQDAINAANQGLLEAKGLTQEQAQKLVGCVRLVTEAEQRIDSAGQALRNNLEQQMEEVEKHCLNRLAAALDEVERRQVENERRLADAMDVQAQQNRTEFTQLAEENQTFHKQLLQDAQAFEVQQSERAASQDSRIATLSEQHAAQAERQDQWQLAYSHSMQERIEAHEADVKHRSAAMEESLVRSLESQRENLTNSQEQLADYLSALVAKQALSLSHQRLVLVGATVLSIASLGWQAAQHWALL